MINRMEPVKTSFFRLPLMRKVQTALMLGAGVASGLLHQGCEIPPPEAPASSIKPVTRFEPFAPQPAAAPSQKAIPAPVLEDFNGADLAGTLNTMSGRYFYTWGSLKFAEKPNAMRIVGVLDGEIGTNGFGVNTEQGKNGPAFMAEGAKLLTFDASGTLPCTARVEIVPILPQEGEAIFGREKIILGELKSITPGKPVMVVLYNKLEKGASKIQFVPECGSSKMIDLTIDNIRLIPDDPEHPALL
jgi:hypothetical protein